jgi:YfiH family protein
MIEPVFIVPDWPAPTNIRAAASTRSGGVSHIEYASFNLASHVGDSAEAVATNREILQESLQLPEQPVWLTQVHGVDVLRHDGETPMAPSHEYDACYSNQSGKVCAVLTADCLPVLFCSRDGVEVASAHAGWRGLADGVLAATVDAFACARSDILAWLGPAIGPGSFEVGADVYHRFLAQWHAYGEKAVADCFVPHREEHWLCDIYALARLQLDALGVTAVYGGGEDTCANWQNFYSFRRDGATGRMVSLVWRTD